MMSYPEYDYARIHIAFRYNKPMLVYAWLLKA
jgi:hypothetical protein